MGNVTFIEKFVVGIWNLDAMSEPPQFYDWSISWPYQCGIVCCVIWFSSNVLKSDFLPFINAISGGWINDRMMKVTSCLMHFHFCQLDSQWTANDSDCLIDLQMISCIFGLTTYCHIDSFSKAVFLSSHPAIINIVHCDLLTADIFYVWQ